MTVRKTVKWFDRFHKEQERAVALVDSIGKCFGYGKLAAAWAMPLSLVAPACLLFDPDPDCRTLHDVGESIGAGPDDMVTVLWFECEGGES